MLCSAPAGKKSGSKWLDRLRSNKGIPTGDNLDLDYFLTDHPNTFSDSDLVRSNSESTHLDQRHFPNGNEPSEISNNNGDKQWVGIMSNVLCELFNMGGYPTQSSKLSRKKCSRKQTNPKFCVISSPSNNVLEKRADFCRKDENIPAKSSFDNDMMDMKEENMEDENIEEEKGDKEELSGYSRSEVTVIDTSSPGWKFEKLVFRRKNVWKVREKKGKSNFFGRKKRKWSNGSDKNSDGNKKTKFAAYVFGSSKETNGEQDLTPLNEGQKSLDGTKKEVYKDSKDEKRLPFPRFPRKSRNVSSSVILIDGIPTNKRNEANLHKTRS